MKKGMTMIELIAVMAVLATVMGIGSIRLVRSQENKGARQEITTVYNTFSSHNRNISRGKSGSMVWTFTGDNKPHKTINIVGNDEEAKLLRTITGDKISFSFCSGTIILGKDIKHEGNCIGAFPYFSTLYICEDGVEVCDTSSNKLLAEIQFHEVTNNISLIRTGKFTQNN